MKNKICVAGNIILDLLYPISGYPAYIAAGAAADGLPYKTNR